MSNLEKQGPQSKSLPGSGRQSITRQLDKQVSFSLGSSITSEVDSAVLTSSTIRRRESRIDDIGLNTLRFSSLGIHGREEEIASLKGCLSRLTGGTKRQLVLIGGFSGTGKTALASTLKAPVERLKGTFLSGKFEFLMQDEPYSAIASVCCDLCERVSSLRDEGSNTFEDIHRTLTEDIDKTELTLLNSIVPDLEEFIGSSISSETQSIGANQSSLDKRIRLVYAFQKFIRIMSSFFAPLVIVLDDLQWANAASLELLETLMTDDLMENLMIIGCYRSNEVDKTHRLSRCVKDLKGTTTENDFTITEIDIEDLSISATNSILMALLRNDDESSTLPLATLCHKRTNGNAFFLLEFVVMMKDRKLIKYDVVTFKWTWDITTVENETAATGNVVNLLKDKMNKTTADTIQLLQIASCLGSSFEKKTLFLVWTKLATGKISSRQRDESSFDMLLNQCVEDGYLEMTEMSSCRFLHDKVQEAAMSLIPSNLLVILQHDIGMILLENLQEDELEAAIFVVTGLLNASNAEDIKVAEMNLRASERAKSMSAFSSAAHFAEKGIELLPADSWKKHQLLTLSLHSVGAEAESYSGNFKKAKYYCREVMQQKNLSFIDKHRVYLMQIENKDSAGHPEEALEMCLQVLEQNGCKFPKSTLKRRYCALRGVLTHQKCPPVKEVTSKQRLTDQEKCLMMNLMIRLSTVAYRTHNIHLGILSTIQRVRWSLEYGICDESLISLAQLGYMVMHSLGKVQEGIQYGEIALSLLEKCPKSFHSSHTIYIVYSYIYCWIRPHQITSKNLMEGYMAGMKVGNIEWAMWNILFYVSMQLFGGAPLESVDEDCSIYATQMEGLKKQHTLMILELEWQTVENLRGRSDNTTILTGERMNEDKLLNEVVLSSSSKLFLLAHSFYKCFLCMIFGDHELGAKIAIDRGDRILKETPGQCIGQFDPFFRGICLYAMARKTRKAKYKKHAKKVRSKLSTWVKNGYVNVVHHLKLLDAEHAALVGKYQSASKMYEEASIMAVRQGYIHDAAVANERYAEHLLESKDCEELPNAVYRLKEAIKFYKSWGAHAKVQMLLKKYADILPRSTEPLDL